MKCKQQPNTSWKLVQTWSLSKSIIVIFHFVTRYQFFPFQTVKDACPKKIDPPAEAKIALLSKDQLHYKNKLNDKTS